MKKGGKIRPNKGKKKSEKIGREMEIRLDKNRKKEFCSTLEISQQGRQTTVNGGRLGLWISGRKVIPVSRDRGDLRMQVC